MDVGTVLIVLITLYGVYKYVFFFQHYAIVKKLYMYNSIVALPHLHLSLVITLERNVLDLRKATNEQHDAVQSLTAGNFTFVLLLTCRGKWLFKIVLPFLFDLRNFQDMYPHKESSGDI